MKNLRELQEEYPDCFKPIHRFKVTKIIGYKNRPPLEEWKKNIKLWKN